MFCGLAVLTVLAPLGEQVENGDKAEALLGQAVLDLGWNLRVRPAYHKAVLFQFPQLSREHTLTQAGKRAQ